jgi:hypothetical protein
VWEYSRLGPLSLVQESKTYLIDYYVGQGDIKEDSLPSYFRESYLTRRESKQNKKKKEIIPSVVQRKTYSIPANSSTPVDMTKDITVGNKRHA